MAFAYVMVAGFVAVCALGFLAPATPTTVAEVLGHFAAALSDAVCLGGLVLILLTGRPVDRGILDPAAFRAHLAVERLAVVWVAAALAMVVVQAAADAGVAATRMFASGKLGAALSASETGRTWVVAAGCAAVLAVFSRLTVRSEGHMPRVLRPGDDVVGVGGRR